MSDINPIWGIAFSSCIGGLVYLAAFAAWVWL